MIQLKKRNIFTKGNVKEKLSDRFLLRLVSSYSFLLVIILIFGVLMYYFGINNVRKNLMEESQVNLTKAVSDVDSSFRIMSSLNSQISNDSEIVKLMQNKTINHKFFLQALDAKISLTNLLAIQNMTFFRDVFLYFQDTDYILSANEFEKSSLYYHYNKRYHKEYYTEYMALLTNPVNAGRPQNLSRFSKTRDDFLLYTYPMSIYRNYSRAPVTICYRINKSYFEDLFKGLNIYETGFIYIKDGEGKEVLRLTAPSSVPFTAEEFNNKTKDEDQSGYITLNDEKMIVTKVTSGNNQWDYYLVQPQAMVFRELVFFQGIYWAAIVLVLILGLCLLILLTGKNIKPMKQIEHRLKNSLAEEEAALKIQGYDVMHSIDHYVSLLIDKKATLQMALEHQRPIIFSAYLTRLMKGLSDTREEVEQIAEVMNIKYQENQFLILYLGVYLNELEFYIDDVIQNKNSFQEVIKEVLHRYFGDKILIYEADFQSFGVLISRDIEGTSPASDNDDFSGRIQSRFYQSYTELKNTFSLIIYGGVSGIFTDLLYTWQAMQQAAEALRHAGPEHILQQYNEIKKDVNRYFYPMEMEGQLINFIINGKQNQAALLLKNIFHENFIERSLSITMSKWLLSDLRNTLLKVRFLLNEDEDKEKIKELDDKFNQKKSFELIETIALDLCRIHDAKMKNHSIIDRIQLYIRENYADSSLSLSKISQEFDISESYFSALFKKVTNQNFSEYLENIRIQKAVNLLSTTNYNVNDIAQKIGYNNPVSFRRAFKRIYGTNPAAIRGDKPVYLFEGKESVIQ